MPYTPPAGNAVDFDFGATYAVPVGNALVFDFDPQVVVTRPKFEGFRRNVGRLMR